MHNKPKERSEVDGEVQEEPPSWWNKGREGESCEAKIGKRWS